MAIVNVVDDGRQANALRVFSNKAARVTEAYSYAFISSATATGVIASAPGILHSVIFQDSATATTYLVLSDAAAGVDAVGSTASAMAQFGTITKNTFIFDAIFNSGLCYRVTGTAIGPTLITYTVAS